MVVKGWYSEYDRIVEEFGFSKKEDRNAAKLLDSILEDTINEIELSRQIKGNTVFVFGAGPSLLKSVKFVSRHFDKRTVSKITKIAADGATSALLENKIVPDIVVTDLDGDRKSLLEASRKGAIMVVHAHGDNKDALEIARKFQKCIGTTQTRPLGKIHNFGGFTDGDRCVFLADHFRAKRVILFGMDFGTNIGKYSKKKIPDKRTKIRKLRKAKSLLEWLASKRADNFYTTSEDITDFKKIGLKELEDINLIK